MGGKQKRNYFRDLAISEEILDRHWKGMDMIPPNPIKLASAVKLVESKKDEVYQYEVKSSNRSSTYVVILDLRYECELTDGDGACEGECSKCHVCIHMTSCTCPDYEIHEIMCKHIHLAKFVFDNSTFDPHPKPSVRPLYSSNEKFEAVLHDLNWQVTQKAFKKIRNSQKMKALEKLNEAVQLIGVPVKRKRTTVPS